MNTERQARILKLASERKEPLPMKDRKYPLWKVLAGVSASTGLGAGAGMLTVKGLERYGMKSPKHMTRVNKAMAAAFPALAASAALAKRLRKDEIRRLGTIPKDKHDKLRSTNK